MTASPARVGPFPLWAAGPLTLMGAIVAVIGGLTWPTESWALRAAGLVAVVVGGYVLLVGIGLLRVRAELGRRVASAAVDAAVIATVAGAATPADDCAADGSCASCDTACALRR